MDMKSVGSFYYDNFVSILTADSEPSASRPTRAVTNPPVSFPGLPRRGAVQATGGRQGRRPRVPAGDDLPAADAAPAAVRARVM